MPKYYYGKYYSIMLSLIWRSLITAQIYGNINIETNLMIFSFHTKSICIISITNFDTPD